MRTNNSVSVEPPTRFRLRRSRWAAIGAAVAVAIGASGLFVANAEETPQTSSFVAITPQRIVDTRSNIGLTGPFSSLVARDVVVTGPVPTPNGTQVVVPLFASAVVLNVTAVRPTANGFISVRPADASGAPTTSSLNFLANQVIPNAVTVRLPIGGGDAGKIEIIYDAFSAAGPTTNVLVDVVGYYLDDEPGTTLVVSAAAFTASNAGVIYTSGCARGATIPTIRTALALPVGARISRIIVWAIDSGAGDDTLSLTKTTTGFEAVASVTTTGNGGIQRVSAVPINPEVVEIGEYFALEYMGTDTTAFHSICGAEIDYINP